MSQALAQPAELRDLTTKVMLYLLEAICTKAISKQLFIVCGLSDLKKTSPV